MKIMLNTETETPLPSAYEHLARLVLSAENLPPETEVSVTFVSSDAIAQLNTRYRNKSGPTDVLSFSCDEVATARTEGAPLLLGDVVIAPEIALAQSKGAAAGSFEAAQAAELNLLLVHGLLHLCGYDHEDSACARHMEARQDELLHQWACQR
jgi:probable rRNA maturation factor